MYRGSQHTNIDLVLAIKHNQLDDFEKNMNEDILHGWKRHRSCLDRYVRLHPRLERTWKDIYHKKRFISLSLYLALTISLMSYVFVALASNLQPVA